MCFPKSNLGAKGAQVLLKYAGIHDCHQLSPASLQMTESHSNQDHDFYSYP